MTTEEFNQYLRNKLDEVIHVSRNTQNVWNRVTIFNEDVQCKYSADQYRITLVMKTITGDVNLIVQGVDEYYIDHRTLAAHIRYAKALRISSSKPAVKLNNRPTIVINGGVSIYL